MTNAPRRENIEWLDVWIVDGVGTTLPRVLLIGDSITRGYRDETARLFEGKASVSRLATSKSLGDPVLLEETALVARAYCWDVIHFNNGLHGSDYTEDEYGTAWPDWLALLRQCAPQAQMIWASTTAVRDKSNLCALGDFNPRVNARNAIATRIVDRENIPTNDLYSVSEPNPNYYADDGVHFNAEGVRAMAERVAASVSRCL